jgi:membrane protease YdiL (CAAX protease family)
MPFLKSLGRMTGLLLIGFACVGVPMAAMKLGALPLLHLALGARGRSSSVLNAALMTMAMAAGFWSYVRFVERRPVTELTPRPALTLLGVILAIALIGAPMLALYATGFYRLQAYQGISGYWPVIPTIVAAGVFEEILFRGLIFTALERVMGSLAALFVQSAVFAAPHMFNASWTGWTDLAAGALIGGMWTCLYILWRNIWAVAFHHAAWNLTIVASGLPLSGLEDFRTAAPFRSVYSGPDLVTGGAAGPEPSIVTLAVVAVALAALLALAKRTKKLRRPGSEADTVSGELKAGAGS